MVSSQWRRKVEPNFHRKPPVSKVYQRKRAKKAHTLTSYEISALQPTPCGVNSPFKRSVGPTNRPGENQAGASCDPVRHSQLVESMFDFLCLLTRKQVFRGTSTSQTEPYVIVADLLFSGLEVSGAT